MKFYLLEEPSSLNGHPDALKYARFTHIGTWTDAPLCGSCGQQLSRLIEPLQIKWDVGSDVMGDFSWCGYTTVITDRAKSVLQEARFPCRFGEVEVVPYRWASQGQVRYPYQGPKLHWLLAEEYVQLNEAESGVKIKIDCAECGQKRYNFKRKGIVIDGSAWAGQPIFEIQQFRPSGAMFVTETGLQMVRSNGLTNIALPEAGVID